MLTKISKGEVSLKDNKNILVALTELPSTLEAMLDQNSELMKNSENISKALVKQQAEQQATNTKTTADLFAHSFEYLFNKVTLVIGELVNMFKLSWIYGGGEISEDDKLKYANNASSAKQNLSGFDSTKLKDMRDQDRYDELMNKAKAGSLTTEEYREMYGLAKKGGFTGDGMEAARKFVKEQVVADAGPPMPGLESPQTQDLMTPAEDKKELEKQMALFLGNRRVAWSPSGDFNLDKSNPDYAYYTSSLDAAQKAGLLSSTDGVTYHITNVNSTDFLGFYRAAGGGTPKDSGESAAPIPSLRPMDYR
jgi:hypothetical protein